MLVTRTLSKVNTIDPLHHVWVTPIMMPAIPTTAPGEKTGRGDGTTPSTYSHMQDDGPGYVNAFIHTLT